ncbi:MAG: lyase family protein [Phycisphaerales bacterium JB039]
MIPDAIKDRLTSPNDTYTSPLATRNASGEMLRIWSPRHKFNTWRRIWLAVAEAMHEVTKNDAKGAPSASSGASSTAATAPPAPSGPLVTREQVEELRAVVDRGITDAEIARAAELERDLRHDVMAHVHCLGEQAPKARPIIHLGMTSQDVVCNADLMIIAQATMLLFEKTIRLIMSLGEFAKRTVDIPALGFTHYQAAQPTTVGRRAAQWAAELEVARGLALQRHEQGVMRVKGLRGATGTQASYLSLLGDGAIVDEVEARSIPLMQNWAIPPVWDDAGLKAKQDRSAKWLEVERDRSTAHHTPGGRRAAEEAMERLRGRSVDDERRRQAQGLIGAYTFPLASQTYPRVLDAITLSDLASIASVLHKIATDIRLLSNRKELDEPFGDKQIGSSAMPYKRNPMKCERICGLTRFVMNLVGNAYDTAATQWLERTLDDSSNRRLSLPEAFLALDGALDLMHQVASGLVVHEAMVRKNLMAELPFLATENILMAAVKAGADRQDYHEKIRAHAQAAGMRVKQEGLDNDLLDRLKADPAFGPPALKHALDWDNLMDPMQYIGRSIEQTERFLKDVVEPLREQYGDELARLGDSDRGV